MSACPKCSTTGTDALDVRFVGEGGEAEYLCTCGVIYDIDGNRVVYDKEKGRQVITPSAEVRKRARG